MSQTETLLLIVLGFALATLIALFFGRLVWATALRLGARRMRKQVPSSLIGLQTERDRLRAEYAMLSHRLSAKLEDANLRMAEQMAEVSRLKNRLEMAQEELTSKWPVIKDLEAKIEELEASRTAQAEANAALEASLADREAEIAALRSRALDIPAIEMTDEISSDGPADRRPPLGLHDRIAKLHDLARTVAAERGAQAGRPGATPADPLVAEKLRDAQRETQDIQRELERLDAEWSKRLSELQPVGNSAGVTQPPRGVANVVSLANRIRALKRDINPQ